MIENCVAFSELPPETAAELVRRMSEKAWKAGEVIIRQGDPGDWMMIVVEGTARIDVHTSALPATTVARMGPSELVGEMALLTRQVRMADVVAETDVVAYVLPSKEFEEVANLYPELGMVLTHVVADRLGRGNLDGLAGKQIERYRIVRCVGRGGMASVYEAIEEESGRRVALKMMSHRLLFERGALARFQREADVLQSVSHRNIAHVERRFRAFRTFYIAMEFCEGPTLEQRIQERGRLTEAETRGIVGQVATALALLHSKGVIHRDVKPSNLILTGGDVVKLTDFGLAKPTTGNAITNVTEARSVLGTPHYMPPECLTGGDSGQSGDIYALGCVALECLLGRCPFDQASYPELLEAKRQFVAPTAAELGISDDTHAFIRAALAPDLALRPTVLAGVAAWAEDGGTAPA